MAKKDYDYANAFHKTGIERSSDGHLPSINPTTGAVLKSPTHETHDLAVKGEEKAGNIIGNIRGEELSIPTSKKGFLLDLPEDNGFYGHNKVPSGKQDASGFYKHMKRVAEVLF